MSTFNYSVIDLENWKNKYMTTEEKLESTKVEKLVSPLTTDIFVLRYKQANVIREKFFRASSLYLAKEKGKKHCIEIEARYIDVHSFVSDLEEDEKVYKEYRMAG